MIKLFITKALLREKFYHHLRKEVLRDEAVVPRSCKHYPDCLKAPWQHHHSSTFHLMSQWAEVTFSSKTEDRQSTPNYLFLPISSSWQHVHGIPKSSCGIHRTYQLFHRSWKSWEVVVQNLKYLHRQSSSTMQIPTERLHAFWGPES